MKWKVGASPFVVLSGQPFLPLLDFLLGFVAAFLHAHIHIHAPPLSHIPQHLNIFAGFNRNDSVNFRRFSSGGEIREIGEFFVVIPFHYPFFYSVYLGGDQNNLNGMELVRTEAKNISIWGCGGKKRPLYGVAHSSEGTWKLSQQTSCATMLNPRIYSLRLSGPYISPEDRGLPRHTNSKPTDCADKQIPQPMLPIYSSVSFGKWVLFNCMSSAFPLIPAKLKRIGLTGGSVSRQLDLMRGLRQEEERPQEERASG